MWRCRGETYKHKDKMLMSLMKGPPKKIILTPGNQDTEQWDVQQLAIYIYIQ